MDDRDKQSDLAKLADAFFENLRQHDWGGIGLDAKRPFGNSAYLADILEIIGWEPECDLRDGPEYSRRQDDYADELYSELADYLKAEWRRLHP